MSVERLELPFVEDFALVDLGLFQLVEDALLLVRGLLPAESLCERVRLARRLLT